MLLRTALACAALVAALPTPTVLAQTPAAAPKAATLGVGDPAPALAINKWVKGSPVASFEKGKTYVVEFWATWCGPCIAGMPHLSELQAKYADKGLTIIGVTAEDPRNSLDKVEAMVKEKGDKMAYTVAWDDGRKTNEAYMKAAQQNGIPCAFLVDGNGKIAYIGHPARIDATLDTVVAGKHDLAKLSAEAKKAAELEGKMRAIQGNLNKAAGAKDWEAALKACDDMIALDPAEYSGMAVTKFMIIANEIKDMDRANKLAKEISEGVVKDDAEALNGLAWNLVDPESTFPNAEKRDFALGLKIAQRAVELTKEKNGPVLDTLARAYFATGDAAKAVETQKKAIALDPRLTDPLKEYEEAAAKRG